MAEDRETKEKEEEEAPPKKSSLKFIIIGIAVVVLGAGGFFAWNMVNQEKAEEQTEKPQGAQPTVLKKEEVKIIYPLDSFIVNLMDKAGVGNRYLKVRINLQVGSQEDKSVLEKHEPQIRDTALLLLSSQSYKEVSSMEGKLELKQSLLYRVNQVFGGNVVQRIYFTEFVVQ